MTKEVYYAAAPHQCDICENKIKNVMYDAPTKMGPWANMCLSCWVRHRRYPTLGTGRGQMYEKQPDGRWLKVSG
jgi:hypothetical protein